LPKKPAGNYKNIHTGFLSLISKYLVGSDAVYFRILAEKFRKLGVGFKSEGIQ